MSEDHILCAYALDGTGRGKPLKGDAISKQVKDDAPAWVHFDADAPETREWLDKEVPYLDDIIIEALLAEETRPRLIEHGEGLLLILRGVNLNENADAEDMISIRLYVDQHRIISTRKRKLKAVTDIRERLEAGIGPKNAADFLVELVTKLSARMDPVIQGLDDQTDAIEEAVIEEPDVSKRHAVNDIRKAAIVLRRYISPQRDAIMGLRISDIPWLEQQHKRRLQEALDRLTRYVEDLDAIRERGQIVKDELSNALADRMNKNLYVLSLIAALFLPLGFITGLLGINVGGMPGVDSPVAFAIVCALCAVFFVFEYLLFRFLRWL